MLIAKMSKNGQVVIPNKIRKELGLFEGDIFSVDQVDNSIIFRKLVAQSTPRAQPTRTIVPTREPSFDEIKQALELSMK